MIRCVIHGDVKARNLHPTGRVCVCSRCFDEAIRDLEHAFAEEQDPTIDRPQGDQRGQR